MSEIGSRIWRVPAYLPYLQAELTDDAIAAAEEEYVSYPLAGLVPFDGDGHWHVCLDYRNNQFALSVSYIDVECDDETPIASSFSEYLSLLRVEVDDDVVVHSVVDIESVKQQLASQLGALRFGRRASRNRA